jgi:hypothetical protein
MMENATLGQIYLQVFTFFLANYHSTTVPVSQLIFVVGTIGSTTRVITPRFSF